MLKIRFLAILLLLSGIAAGVFAQEQIGIGDTVQGSEDNDAVEYELELQEDQTVAITLQSDEFDTYLEIYDEDNNLINWNDDYQGSRSTSYLLYTADDDVTITISVRSFGSDGPDGDYELSVEEVEITDHIDAGALEYGDTVTIEPNGASEITFTFEGSEGDVISINVNSSNYEDTRMLLEDPRGHNLMEDDDSGPDNNPAIRRFELPDDGEYTVTITGYGDSQMFSPLDISLEETELLLLNDGAQTISLDSETSTDAMFFDVEEDQSYIITVTFNDDIDSSLYLRILEEGADYPRTSVTIAGTSAFTFIYTAQDTGRAQFQLEAYIYEDSIDVTLEAQPMDQ